MVTKVIEAAPPTRKYEIMSGKTKAALKASASTPRPNSQTMYLTRTRPMMRERKVDAIRMMVAEKAECAWEGRRKRRLRAQREEPGAEDSVEGDSPTRAASTAPSRRRAARM